MTNPFEDILKSQTTGYARKLPHADACGYYAALRDGVTQPIVVAASGLSQGAISHLAAAGKRKGGQIRYPKVAAEYLALGREAFIHKYVTTIIRDRLRVAADQVSRHTPSAVELAGVNPRANKYRGLHNFTDQDFGATIEIAFAREIAIGWRWRTVALSDGRVHSEYWRGDPRHEERSFATSEDAYTHCRIRYSPTDAEIDSGAHEAALDDLFFETNPTNPKFRSIST